MSVFKKKRLAIATIVYWFLLLYILAALGWWFIALQTQNKQMTNYKLQELKMDDPAYITKVEHIQEEEHRKTARNIGEGSFIFLVILVGAIFVYRAVRRQFRLQQQQQNFMMAVTHELKTPIAVAKLNMETLQKYKLDEARQQKIIQSALQEINRLNTLANNILVSAQLEGGRYRLSKDELDLSALTGNAAGDFKNRFPDRKWEIQITPDLAVNGDTLLLQVLVNNLIENAVKYSPKNSTITVALEKKNGRPVLMVKDEGPGIPANEKKKIFQKFYRIGNEETRTTKGTGLGLYISKKIAADHKAALTVSDNSVPGSIFTVVF